MLTLPKLVDRPAQPFLAIREKVSIPFGEAIGPIMGELFGTLEKNGIQPAGPPFFKYNIIQMPQLEIEFGAPVAGAASNVGRLIAGVMPAGRYAELTYWGHYDNLMDVNALMIGWAKEKGIAWDVTARPDGDHFVARLEIYHNSPDQEPDPEKWETTLAIKVRD